jgi:Tfp pilus assembly protein PilP
MRLVKGVVPVKLWLSLLWFGLVVIAAPVFGQEPPAEEPAPITGGTTYEPIHAEDEKLRDPFKSPFEIEKEERDQLGMAGNVLEDADERLPYSISELDLRGIYYQAQSGYRAIFRIGDDYKWWPAGTKFRDADLVNITDGAVVFKHYSVDDDIQVREVVKELHRGEE